MEKAKVYFSKVLTPERVIDLYNALGFKLSGNISNDYVRIYLYPYFQKEENFELLVKYFILSSEEKSDINQFISEVKKLINKDNKGFINEYLNSGNYLISHSDIYKKNYDPHYLVIHRKFVKNIYKN